MELLPPTASCARASLPVRAGADAKPADLRSEVIKRRLLRRGVVPTPKILHALLKKETQKSLRKAKKQAALDPSPPLPDAQRQALEHEAYFGAAAAEYRELSQFFAGKPWERLNGADLSELKSLNEGEVAGRLKGEHLEELREFLAERNRKTVQCLLDDDVEVIEGVVERREKKGRVAGDDETIRLLVQRLCSINTDIRDWRFPKLMKQSGLYFTEMHLLKILEGLGVLGNWRHALSVVEWVYVQKEYRHTKSRFVYTKLLAVLGKAKRPNEALHVFKLMREDGQIYPDMPAYHSIAVTLGQAGLVEELINIIECMRQKPSKKMKNMKRKDWDPCLEPDLVVFNAVLNACVPSQQWKGVSWVLQQIRLAGLKPNSATYGLAMEVMLKAEKYDLVHKFFEKMQRGGLAPNSLTYRVLVKAFWKEGLIDEAVKAVKDMEQRGIVGTATVYYELACCLCNNGRWQDAIVVVEKLKRLPLTKPMAVTFTGMILSSMDGGYISECITIFECMKDHCALNMGTINAMLKVYSRNDMFAKAKALFESTKDNISSHREHFDDGKPLKPDAFTYSSMLDISASSHQWEYFEYVYKEMALSGYQLDQRKHAWLLIQASRSGKFHLLEHAFDTVLEAGEIPHVSLFMEMTCQTISQENFERTVLLINGMAHASLQVSEKQWVNFFQKSRDRVSEDKLQNLLRHLNSSDLLSEDPVPNFLSSLQSLCGTRPLKKTILLAVPDNPSEDNSTTCDNDGVSKSWAGNVGAHLDGTVDDGPSVSDVGTDCTLLNSFLNEKSETETTEKVPDLLAARLSSNPCLELPSASKILETWRENAVKDGFFPFQHRV